jgi:hypothetical protein
LETRLAQQTDDFPQMPQARDGRPTNPLIPGLQHEGAGAETQGAEPAVLAADEIAQLGPHQGRIPTGMLFDHQIVPQRVEQVVRAAQQMQVQTLDVIDAPRYCHQGGKLSSGVAQAMPRLGPRLARRQRQQPASL